MLGRQESASRCSAPKSQKLCAGVVSQQILCLPPGHHRGMCKRDAGDHNSLQTIPSGNNRADCQKGTKHSVFRSRCAQNWWPCPSSSHPASLWGRVPGCIDHGDGWQSFRVQGWPSPNCPHARTARGWPLQGLRSLAWAKKLEQGGSPPASQGQLQFAAEGIP